jgi:hypothetical protein
MFHPTGTIGMNVPNVRRVVGQMAPGSQHVRIVDDGMIAIADPIGTGFAGQHYRPIFWS